MFWGTWPGVPSSSSSFPSTRCSGNTAALNSLRVDRAEPSIQSSQLARHWSHRETSWPSRDTRASHCDTTGSGAPDTVPHPVPPTSPGLQSPLLSWVSPSMQSSSSTRIACFLPSLQMLTGCDRNLPACTAGWTSVCLPKGCRCTWHPSLTHHYTFAKCKEKP